MIEARGRPLFEPTIRVNGDMHWRLENVFRGARTWPKLSEGWRDSPAWGRLTFSYMSDPSAAMARRTEAQGAPSSKVIADLLISTPSLPHNSPRSGPTGAAFISL